MSHDIPCHIFQNYHNLKLTYLLLLVIIAVINNSILLKLSFWAAHLDFWVFFSLGIGGIILLVFTIKSIPAETRISRTGNYRTGNYNEKEKINVNVRVFWDIMYIKMG